MNTNMEYDVAVVGGGPAGASAAYYAAQAGLKTILFEKQPYPRDKLCGGGLSARNLPLLGEHARKAINCIIDETRLYAPSYRSFSCSKSYGYFVTRKDFDHAMAKDAAKAGAKVMDNCPVETFNLIDSGNHEVKTGRDTFVAKYIVLAAGIRGKNRFAKVPGIPNKYEKDYLASTVESETVIDNAILEEIGISNKILAIFFGAVPNGYGWYFVKNGRLNIGIGATAVLFKETGALNAYHNFVHELRAKGFLPRRLELAKERSFPLPFKRTAGCTVSGKVLLAGDAAGFVSPVSGEGIYYGIKAGQLAAEAIRRNLEHGLPLISYQKNWQKAFGRDLNKYGYPLREVVYKNKKRMELVVSLGRHDKKMALLFTRMLYGEYSYSQTIRKAILRLPLSILKTILRK